MKKMHFVVCLTALAVVLWFLAGCNGIEESPKPPTAEKPCETPQNEAQDYVVGKIEIHDSCIDMLISRDGKHIVSVTKGIIQDGTVDDTTPLDEMVIGLWTAAWSTKDYPSSLIHHDYYRFLPDGVVEYWYEDRVLKSERENGKHEYEISRSNVERGTWKPTGGDWEIRIDGLPLREK